MRPNAVQLALVCLSLASISQAQQPTSPQPPPGEHLKFSTDGSPWKHPDTDLRFPQKMGEFELTQGFKAKDKEGGIALTYVNKASDIKADLLLTPCPKEKAISPDIMPHVEEQLRQMARELRQLASTQGYKEVEENRGKIERGQIDLWELGIIPIAQAKMEFSSSDPSKAESHPPLSQWLIVTLYQDSWIQTSILMPVSKGAEGEKLRGDFLMKLVQVIREPSLFAELGAICEKYLKDPLSDESRAGADSLWRFSQESPVLEITLPGEALTPALNQLATVAPGSEQDVLRAYLIGAGAKTLLEESIDARLAEGARLMTVVYDMLKKKDSKVNSSVLEELKKAVAENKAADWLRRRMNAPQVE